MKKIFYTILLVTVSILIASCEKNPIPMTSTEAMAGDWYVMCDGCDASGNVIEGLEDPFGLGNWHTYTYNTAKDNGAEMFVSDGKTANFWDYAAKVTIDLNNLTFQTNGAVKNENYDCEVTITGGKITLGGATTPSGVKADAIEYYIVFSDDNYVGKYYDKLKVYGYRYTGLANDD